MKLFIPDIQEQFIQACRNADIKKMRYFLTSESLLNHADINEKGDALFAACAYRRLEVAEYLLSSEDLKVHADITYRSDSSNYCFNIACSYGCLDIVKFMVESPLITKHSKINEYTISHACINNEIDVLRYLASKFSFDEYFNINALQCIIDMNNEKLLKFFIEECKVRMTKEISDFLNAPYVAPRIQYIGGESNYLKCELFKKKALIMFNTTQHLVE